MLVNLAWGTLAGLLLAKVVLSFVRRRPRGAEPAGLRATVIVPFRNEDPELFRQCLTSIATQIRLPQRVHIVDDASTSFTCLLVAWSMLPELRAQGIEASVTRRRRHGGKREAFAIGVRADPTADVYVGVDSDTVLQPAALAHGLRRFADPRVRCVTGLVLARNAKRNLLTRLIDVRYANAFLFERSAYSALGSVLCACGSLAFYSGQTVRANLDDFVSQTFLGRPAMFGDDRRLTYYCLQDGAAVLEPRARAETAVPERLGHWVRQQNRWNKSFFRESLWMAINGRSSSPATWLSFLELSCWATFSAVLVVSLVLRPMAEGVEVLGTYGLFFVASSYLRSIKYLTGRFGFGFWQRVRLFLLTPLYAVLHLGIQVPLRLFSLATLRRNGWGTRAVTEVAA